MNATSGLPTIAGSDRLVCSPGAPASLQGSGFADPGSEWSDAAGQSLELGGTKVKIDDQYVPVLAASESQVSSLCPDSAPGTPLVATVETDAGTSQPLTVSMRTATPTILSVEGTGQNQGMIWLSGSSLATARDYRMVGQPAQPGDEVWISASGLGGASDITTETVRVEVGGMNAEVESVKPVSGQAGMYSIQVRVPAVIDYGDAMPIQLRISVPDGKQVVGNQVTMAVEPVSQ